MLTVIILSSLAVLSIADGGCCDCTEELNGPTCNTGCNQNICPYDPYCCDVEWDWICADAACTECEDCDNCQQQYGPGGDYAFEGDYGYEDSAYGDYDEYGYDYDCDCNYICGDESPEEWEQAYDLVPPCVVDACGEQMQTCAFNGQCIAGIESVVNDCYQSGHEYAIDCMNNLLADEENNGFTAHCGGDAECGNDLKSLGQCVANLVENYGFCSEEVMKKLQSKSLVKSIKYKSRKLKRNANALKSKSRRSRRTQQRTRKVRGRRQSKLRSRQSRASRRDLQSEYENEYGPGPDYENPEYDYGCYCDCGEEDDEIPPCIVDNCSEQLYACIDQQDCVAGIEGVEATCYEDNDNPEQCMQELIEEANGQQAIELCYGNEEAAGNLQALGQCVLNTFNSGDCGEPYKKLKIKALVRSTKKGRARKVATEQRRSRSLRRARLGRTQRLRRAKLARNRVRMRSRSRSLVGGQGQRLDRVKRARAERGRKLRAERQRKLRSRKQGLQRRNLGGMGPAGHGAGAGADEACCDCTQAEHGTGCSANPACDSVVCPLDSYCCQYSWDGICANGAQNICNAVDYWSWGSYDYGGDDSWYDDYNMDWYYGGYDYSYPSDYNYGYGPDNYGYGFDDSFNYGWDEPNYSDSYDYGWNEPDYSDSFDYGFGGQYNYPSPQPYYPGDNYGYDSFDYGMGSGDYGMYEPNWYYGDYSDSYYGPDNYGSDSFDYGGQYNYPSPPQPYYPAYPSISPDPYYPGDEEGPYGTQQPYYYDSDEAGSYDDCLMGSCGGLMYNCEGSPDCYDGIIAAETKCDEGGYESMEQCVEELIQESNGQQLIDFCNNNETAAGDLQALGQCFLTLSQSGECDIDEKKKLSFKAFMRGIKKMKSNKSRATKKQRLSKRGRSSKRPRSARMQRRPREQARSQRPRRVRQGARPRLSQRVRGQRRERQARAQRARGERRRLRRI